MQSSIPEPGDLETASTPWSKLFGQVWEYQVDAAQRSILFWDTLRQRGQTYREERAKEVPHVLHFSAELVVDGRTLPKPVNYALVRIVPPADTKIDPLRRPFVVIDPRAGHGPGIGGFKADSEIGVAMRAGHPCYFIGFLPDPVPGQTIPDVTEAEAHFLKTVIALHPDADGKPCIIGNCQAGWAVAMLAALYPDLCGPLILAGAPLSYWAGVHGKNPMRYLGGMLGGSWLSALASDLGNGKFDGSWLVQNFERLDPANTLWSKQYNLYSKVDSEAPRYLEFEKWWGNRVRLNAEEIQFISDELFVGNNLAAGDIKAADGTAIDLRAIRTPIVVFCSKDDNITPPQQALDWILDLYDSVDEIRSYGQTIVYTVHETAGHLGLFVSGSVARKEHNEFASNIDFIDTLPPGLYEAVFEPAGNAHSGPFDKWQMRCKARTLDDIRALGTNSPADDRCFATAARVSEINLALYRAFLSPWIKAAANGHAAEWMQRLHPAALPYALFSDANPFLRWLEPTADTVKENREPAAPGNPLIALQDRISSEIVRALDSWRDMRDAMTESIFLSVYGSPALQAMAGIDGQAPAQRRIGKSRLHQQWTQDRIAQLKESMNSGGPLEAIVRAGLYVAVPRGSFGENGFDTIRKIRAERESKAQESLADFKAVVREQFLMLLIDQEGALRTLPQLLPENSKERRKAFEIVTQVCSAECAPSGETAQRLQMIAHLFDLDDEQEPEDATQPPVAPRAAAKHKPRASRTAH